MAPHHNTAVRSLLTNFFRRKAVSVSAETQFNFGRKNTPEMRFIGVLFHLPRRCLNTYASMWWENTQLMPQLRGVQPSCAKYNHTKQKVLK